MPFLVLGTLLRMLRMPALAIFLSSLFMSLSIAPFVSAGIAVPRVTLPTIVLIVFSVLLIGLSSLGAEVAKNIVLAGIKSLCIFDPTPVTTKDSSNIFLFRPTDHGSRVSERAFDYPPHSLKLLIFFL